VAWESSYRASRLRLMVTLPLPRHSVAMLGIAITSWMRFFAFGLIAGAALSLVPYVPIAILGKIDAGAAFLGLVLTLIYARSYEPEVWRRLTRHRHLLSMRGNVPARPAAHAPVKI
jgi:hypothetical protein